MKKNKYSAKKVELDGFKFDSKKEAKRYSELKLLQRAGSLTDLKLQVPFEIVPKTEKFRAVKYIADFTYRVPGHENLFCEDVKGMRKGAAYKIFKIKQKIMYYKLGIEVFEI